MTSPDDIPAPGLPEELSPGESLLVELDRRRVIEIQRFTVAYDPCKKHVNMGLNESYAAKPQVVCGGHALFPELALLALFQKAGWKGVWADTHHKKYFTTMPQKSKGITLDTLAARAVARISSEHSRMVVGCWDLILWHDKLILFVLTRPIDAAARLRRTELDWLAGSLKAGLSEKQFLVVDWSYKIRKAVKVVRSVPLAAPSAPAKRKFMKKSSHT